MAGHLPSIFKPVVMPEEKIIELGELQETITQQLVDAEYDLEKARSPKRKRQVKHAIHFFKSIQHHLNELQESK